MNLLMQEQLNNLSKEQQAHYHTLKEEIDALTNQIIHNTTKLSFGKSILLEILEEEEYAGKP